MYGPVRHYIIHLIESGEVQSQEVDGCCSVAHEARQDEQRSKEPKCKTRFSLPSCKLPTYHMGIQKRCGDFHRNCSRTKQWKNLDATNKEAQHQEASVMCKRSDTGLPAHEPSNKLIENISCENFTTKTCEFCSHNIGSISLQSWGA